MGNDNTTTVTARTAAIEAAYQSAAARFAAANPRSRELHEVATSYLPGGNTRSVLFYAPFPVSTARAQGCRLHDADGHVYVDLLGEYSAGLYGHSHPVILGAIRDALEGGVGFGSHHAWEATLAALICGRFGKGKGEGGMELVRFTNSGTEAMLMALVAAKAWWAGRKMRRRKGHETENEKGAGTTTTGKIVVFEGGYHGGAFVFGHGHGGPGDPVNVPHEYLVARYNDMSSVDALIARHGGHGGEDIAAIVVEPMLGSGGGVCGSPDFLRHLRRTATDIGALLVFDEVMTSRLFDGGGVQSELGISPDLTTLGKYVGGGALSCGAFGGGADVMGLFDPRGADTDQEGRAPLPHAGTFNNNVLTMRAGAAGLERVFTPSRARALHSLGDRLRLRLNGVAGGTTMRVLGCGSILAVHFTATPLADMRSPGDWGADEGDGGRLLDLFHLEMLHAGFYVARRGFVALSVEVGEAEAEGFVGAVEGFLRRYWGLVGG